MSKRRFETSLLYTCLFVALYGVGLLACAPASDSPVRLPYMQPPPGNVYDFTLPDGTRCIYVDGSSFDGGLACDFHDAQLTLEQTIEQMNALGNAGSRQ